MTVPRTTRPADRAPLVRVSRKRPCPVCHKPDNCAVGADGRIVYCRRVRSARQGRDGGWTHFLSGGSEASTPRPQPPPPAGPRGPAERCHEVYRSMLSLLGLNPDHHRHLRERRGLSDEAVRRNRYASMPAPARAFDLCRELSRRFDLAGVPGFWRDARDERWKLSYCAAGILIPVRDVEGRIAALQLRRDEAPEGTDLRYVLLSSANLAGGATSSAPVHFGNVEAVHKSRRVIITEGALKADIIADLLNVGVVGLAGVSNFRAGFGRELRRLLPTLRHAEVCFDADWRTNEHVKHALFRLLRELSSARLAACVRTWPARHKGFDDYLAQGRGATA